MAESTVKLHKRLTTRLAVMTLVLFLAPLVFLYYLSLNSASEMLVHSLRNDLKEKAFLVGADIDRFFDQRRHDVLSLSLAAEFEGADIDAMHTHLREVTESTPYLDVAAILASDGRIVASSSATNTSIKAILEKQSSLRTILASAGAAKSGDILVSEDFGNAGELHVYFLTPIREHSGNRILLVEVSLKAVRGIVADFNERVVGDKYVYLVDNAGRILISGDPSAGAGETFPDLAQHLDLLESFSRQGAVGSTLYIDDDSHEVMAGFADMAEFGINKAMDWSIIAVAPLDDITRPVDRFQRQLTLFTIIIFGAVLLAIILFSRRILRAVQNLVSGAERIGHGEADFRIEPLDNDEFGYLARTFNETLDNLASTQKGALRAQRMEAIGQLTGGIAHDFNNLMAIIVGNAELLTLHTAKDPVAVAFGDAIIAAVERGASLTERLLAFSRKSSLAPVSANVSRLVDDLQDMLQRTLGETIELDVRPCADLWAVDVDPHQFENALINLAINARDAMEGGGTLSIATSNVDLGEGVSFGSEAVPAGQYIKVLVNDSGTGMSPDVVERVFEPFFSTKEVGKGSGLGLSMVYGFVKQSEGHINIRSVEGEGTCFELYLPRSQNEVVDEEVAKPETTLPRGTESILVVEDEEEVRHVTMAVLRAQGYVVIEARTGEEAIEVLTADETIHLLCTDVVLPGGMHGPDIASKARVLQQGIRVLYTTGYAEEHFEEGALLHDPVLRKPFRRAELLKSVREALDPCLSGSPE